ncbi:type II toxin-antitoxin system Phd/YefM family antitoxin [Granulicella mallensis]|uniref:Antitoxin n=1 Tax=Granulicella mallensis TaxID=940614 RepID=A0A7W7ZP24_9BACT|nr:type II toxin-antitoxin system Phd/YefM family antitoxin [Granulicella mallensis]MBB5063178.1 prevent-host-death family protein [Granulicella mallensis]
MDTVNMHEAKTHLSRLVDKAAKGESVVISKAGKPMARLVAFEAPEEKPKQRIGFMKGQMTIPDGFGFKDDFKEEIEELFGLSK